MAAISPGNDGGGMHRTRKLTATTKQHRYESFTRRIARLKIDPVHKVENRPAPTDSSDLTQSHFRTSLDEWAELNLTRTFTSFLNKANPLSENLPQLLHHSDQIFDALLQNIEKKDALSLEPLLSLLAHLAHDLGQSFEKYFSRTVTLVAHVAASHDSADVIEWCFTCLSWMFKYLSRLLVQDLRPLLDIMKPYLAAKKVYIARFSAESLAFLLRKAAALYPKRKEPLALAMKSLFEQKSDDEASQIGLMTLLVDSSLGVEGKLHSSAPFLVKCALETAFVLGKSPQIRSSLEGFLIGMIHRTDREGFKPVLPAIWEYASLCSKSKDYERTHLATSMIQIVVATRKGSRISDWKSTIKAFLDICSAALQNVGEQELRETILSTSAIILQYAPMDQLLPFSNDLLNLTTSALPPSEFFAYCTLVADLGRARFQDLLFPRLQQYIISRWADDQIGLSYLLEYLHNHGSIGAEVESPGYVQCPREWEIYILEALAKTKVNNQEISDALLAAFLRLSRNIQFPVRAESKESFQQILKGEIVSGLKNHHSDLILKRRLAFGWSFDRFLDLTTSLPTDSIELWSLVLDASPICFRLPVFLEACNKLAKEAPPLQFNDNVSVERTRNLLIRNLLAGSHSLREVSLSLLASLNTSESNQWLLETVELALEIIQLPYNTSNTRQIAMLVRKLPQIQKYAPSDPTMQKLVPYFILGLLPQYHEQSRRNVCEALGEIMQNSPMEDEVLEVLIAWLRSPSVALVQKPADLTRKRLTPFQCSNLMLAREKSCQAFENFAHSVDRMHSLAEESHEVESVRIPVNGRALALQVLTEIPSITEKRSRLLTPIFLAAQFGRTRQDSLEASDASVSSHTLSPEIADQDWTLADRKGFLSLLGKFQNPRVLFQAARVYEKLFELLCNGNTDIRKLALLAILSWKDPVLQRYEKFLLQVAEEKTLSAEIGVMLNSESEQNALQGSDRPVVLPVLLRLLFGQIVGRSGTHGSQEARRKSILRMLFRMQELEVTQFLQIALGALSDVQMALPPPEIGVLNQDVIPADQQYGFIRMMLSLLETLQSQFAPYGKYVVDAVLYCTLRSARLLEHDAVSSASISRNIRRTGLQCLVILFEHCPDVDWAVYMPIIFQEAISPKLEIFAAETSQGISLLLRIFSVWCHSHALVPLIRKYDARLPSAIWQCLNIPTGKIEVKTYVLEQVVGPLVDLATEAHTQNNVASEIVQAEVDRLLESIALVLQNTPPKDILVGVATMIPKLSPFANSPQTKSNIIDLLVTTLSTLKHKLTPLAKGTLISAINSLIPHEHNEIDRTVTENLYSLVSSFFDYFKDSPNRLTLCQILKKICDGASGNRLSSTLCFDLNSVSADHLDEIDYDRRLQAYQQISQLEVNEAARSQWLPILYNLLFFARGQDFSIRSNAVSCLRTFIVQSCSCEATAMESLVHGVLLPALQVRVREDSEAVRADIVSLFGLVVQHLVRAPELTDMKILLVGGDEEASFFSNVLHIQLHRRLRALRRLVSEVENGNINCANIANFFIPLLQKFVYDKSDDETAQGVKGQSMIALNTLLQWTEWKQFKFLFRQFKIELNSEDRNEKDAIKLLGHAADALGRAWAEKHQTLGQRNDVKQSHLAASLPSDGVVMNELRSQFIPRLADFVHYKDETQMSFRLPAATTAVKLIKLLPAEETQILCAPIMLDVAQVLRSRTQESRDAARSTLSDMVVLLGPTSVQFVLKELRNVLTRGYQLHVLSYTIHSILVANAPYLKLGDLDYCLRDLATVIMDDIFGVVGLEKENQDYISNMKEVKSSKSFDSMELLCRTASITRLMTLVEPIQTLLTGNLATKQVRKVDELLRRIGVGLARNPAASNRDILVFAFQVIKSFYQEKSASEPRPTTNDERNRQRFLVQLSSANKTSSGTTSSLLYKLARFAIDLVRSTLQKHAELMTPENVHGFLPIIGDALIEAQEDVKISALRLLSAIIKLRMPQLDENAQLYVIEAVKVVQNCTNTNEEAAQAALKLVAAVLRERKSVKIRDSDIADLLHRITPDLEEPDRQGVTFNFIRAVIARKYELPQIYEIVDQIGTMMVTNHASGARDVARGVYVHFLLEYPQSSNRWIKQQKFLVKNLEYDYPEGRQSVMEAINLLLSKTSHETEQELVSTFFMPIVLRMANDEHEGCRELSGALLSQIFHKADFPRLRNLLEPLRSWSEQTENLSLTKLSMQAYSIFFETGRSDASSEISHILASLGEALNSPISEADEDWEMRYHALQLFSKLVESHPSLTLGQLQTEIWANVRSLMIYPHPWVQTTAAGLVRTFLQHCASSDFSKLPLSCSFGLRWNGHILLEILRAGVHVMKRNEGNKDLAAEVTPILLFLGRCTDANGLKMKVKDKKTVELDDPNDDLSNSSDNETKAMTEIPAIQYLLDQSSMILRRESPRLTSAALLPKLSILSLLVPLLPELSKTSLTPSAIQATLLPLQHLTDTNTIPPHSADPTFATTYQELVGKAHEVMEAIQRKIGDTEYVKNMTAVSRIVRDRRAGRRTKRRIERVAEPEKAARDKKRKADRTRDRKREIAKSFQKRRREM